MVLPEQILFCLEALERAGLEAWVVGGCVRDALLGLPPKDYDICTQALPEQIQAVFSSHRLVLAGVKHGTVGVVTTAGVVEITTFRTEGGYADNRHPDWVRFVPDLKEDLARRDFTVNAMAWSPRRGFSDPFGGQSDLKAGLLRTVGDPGRRFREDALRILRGARFCAAYQLRPEEKTLEAMLSQRALMDSLARERVFEELCKFLPFAGVEDLMAFAPILAQVIPELGPMIGFDQRSPHHAYDLYTHVAHVTAGVEQSLILRWAALLHDIGKVPTFTQDETGRGHFYGHAAVGAQMAKEVLHRLRAPTELTGQVVLLIGNHMLRLTPEKKLLRRQCSRFGFDTVCQLLSLQESDMNGKGTCRDEELAVYPQIRQQLLALQEEDSCLSIKDLAVDGNDLKKLGLAGREIGETLRELLEWVLEERLPNEREALLAWVKKDRFST